MTIFDLLDEPAAPPAGAHAEDLPSSAGQAEPAEDDGGLPG
jgi:hypothetical protein